MKKPSVGGTGMNAAIWEDILLSAIATAIGEPARTRMLLSLMDGHARTSTELAAIAAVTPSTASVHLNRLTKNKLVCVSAQGRHRYYSLWSPEVARALESLSVIAGASIKSFVPSAPVSLRRARSCYDHMAGTVAVALHDRFLDEGWLTPDSEGAYEVSEIGRKKLEQLAIDVEELRSLRRRFAFACIDWSERKPHIAGSLGAAILRMITAKKWVVRELDSRALCLTRRGEREICKQFGIRI